MSQARRRRRRRGTRAPLVLLALAAAIALVTIYRNALYLSWSGHGYWRELEGTTFSVAIGFEEDFHFTHGEGRAARIKLSFPFDEAGLGCELNYGVGLFERGSAQRRYLLKFRYDLRNKRCECKDLYFVSGFIPDRATFQLVRVTKEEDAIVETPEPLGVAVTFGQDGENLDATLREVSIAQEEPFRRAERTPLVERFSTSLRPEQREVLVTPRDSIGHFVVQELTRRMERCRDTGECDRIRIAVAMATDPLVLDTLDMAADAGLRVEWIENLHGRDDEHPTRLLPYKWLRGNPLLDATGILPMHTKFVIFGEDTVLSTGANLDFDRWPNSRQVAVVYRSEEVAAIFGELFTMIRTSLYYPVKVDLRDDLVVLFNAERPRGYSAFSAKPYLAIETEQGVRSNAYGILFEVMARTPGPMRLSMSPLSDTCERHERMRCFFELLEDRASQGELELVLNKAFYLGDEPFVGPGGRSFSATPAFRRLVDLFPPDAKGLRLMTRPGKELSMHHERLGLLGDDLVLLGSANYARTGSLNTIEILRDPALYRELAEGWHDSDADEIDLMRAAPVQ